jgi:hypothetical protein
MISQFSEEDTSVDAVVSLKALDISRSRTAVFLPWDEDRDE